MHVGSAGINPWEVPAFRAWLAVVLCFVALCVIQLIHEWPKLREEAKREKHQRKRWW